MVEDFNVSLAVRIAAARKASGKTQQQIADDIATHVNQYQRLEAGKHRVSVYDLTRIAASIGIPAGDLLAPPPQTKMTGLSQDVITLVIAAREAFDTGMLPSDENDALDKALEAFSSRVPYENEPKTKPCPACNGLGAFPETGYDCGECLGGGEVEAND